jgi:hypothetical protein
MYIYTHGDTGAHSLTLDNPLLWQRAIVQFPKCNRDAFITAGLASVCDHVYQSDFPVIENFGCNINLICVTLKELRKCQNVSFLKENNELYEHHHRDI